MTVTGNKKIYFLSDFHLGAPDHAASLERERLIVRFLDEIEHDAGEIFLVGDMFDFWYEYKKVVPRGYVRLLGKLGQLTDAGIAVHFFVGNHDMWMRDYLQTELNIPVYFEPKEFVRYDKTFLVGHGDGLGPGDHGYKRLKKIFRNPVCQWLFGILPPVIGIGVADFMSRRSRAQAGDTAEVFLGEENEWLIRHCKDVLQQKHVDFLVFGHRHLPIDYTLPSRDGRHSRYINLGDWMRYFTYAVFDGHSLSLRSYQGQDHKIIRN
ncbi:MAG: UDP-2,3-diacylglucosamine diphosphatase [Chitinophagaceae bacterium]